MSSLFKVDMPSGYISKLKLDTFRVWPPVDRETTSERCTDTNIRARTLKYNDIYAKRESADFRCIYLTFHLIISLDDSNNFRAVIFR